jgi:hypothetical protein
LELLSHLLGEQPQPGWVTICLGRKVFLKKQLAFFSCVIQHNGNHPLAPQPSQASRQRQIRSSGLLAAGGPAVVRQAQHADGSIASATVSGTWPR